MDNRADIVIPTFNRAQLIEPAVKAALDQSYSNKRIIVIDDGSTDQTRNVLSSFFNHPDFLYIGLPSNVGTAGAKNVGIALSDATALTFHDSDDRPHVDKVLLQSRALFQPDIGADPCLNWALAGHAPGSSLDISWVLTHHTLILPDGRRVDIRRDLSLLDDVFPNLQLGSTVPGEWTHINSGLFSKHVFTRLGGFSDCIEEDREFRNRLILSGEPMWIVPEPLLTKIETADSLTQSAASDYDSARRKSDRTKVWRKVEAWRATGEVKPEPIDLPSLEGAFVSRAEPLEASGALMTDTTRKAIHRLATRITGGTSVAAQ